MFAVAMLGYKWELTNCIGGELQHTHFIPQGNFTRCVHEKVTYRVHDGSVHLSEQMNNKVGLEIYL